MITSSLALKLILHIEKAVSSWTTGNKGPIVYYVPGGDGGFGGGVQF